MLDDKLEEKIKEHAGEIFGQEINLPVGHRERFEQRLLEQKRIEASVEILGDCANETVVSRRQGKAIPLRKIFVAVITIAAIFAGIIITRDTSSTDTQSPELAEVSNYYSLLLEEQIDITKQLIQSIDEEGHRDALLENIERINTPVPDVQMPDDEYIILIANIYANKIESLQDLQNIIRDNI